MGTDTTMFRKSQVQNTKISTEMGIWNILVLFFFTLQYCIGFAISTWICHNCIRALHPEPPSLLPFCTIPLGHPSAPALSILYHPLNLDWQFVSHIILHMFFSHIISPLPSPTESKRLFYWTVFLLLSRIQGYHYHLSKFHIYALVYCIGVFLPDLLHSV